MTFSVNRARARRLEATGAVWDFDLDGVTYYLPREIPLSVSNRKAEFEAMDGTSGLSEILKILLGDQAASFPFDALSQDDLAEIFEAHKQDVGAGLGESSGSSTSSTSTATPSRPTSKRSTASGSRKSTKAR